ncbi:MAG: hypothetical protein LBT40_01135 [Deltaproteobacteria bacterium]|nr:hypothetical protein [Deltaproteobacteria bacterium]
MASAAPPAFSGFPPEAPMSRQPVTRRPPPGRGFVHARGPGSPPWTRVRKPGSGPATIAVVDTGPKARPEPHPPARSKTQPGGQALAGSQPAGQPGTRKPT